MATFRNESFARVVERGLKQTAATLRDADVPFCLVGSLSAWVRGGPESSHDLDFGIRECDVRKAATALEAAGYEIEIPPEDWLIKAWDVHSEDPEDRVLIDLIYAPSGVLITDEVLERCDHMDVLAQTMPVLNAADLMIMKLLSLREQHLNLTSTIATARSIREQIDWQRVRAVTEVSPYARGFFVMAEGLGIVPPVEDTPASQANDRLAAMQVVIRQGGGNFPERQALIEEMNRRRALVDERYAKGERPSGM